MVGVSLLVLVIALAASPAPSRDFAPGEVLIKFVSGSDEARAVEHLSQQSPLQLEGLAPVVRRLGTSVGMPLTVTQVTSGNWIVLKIDIGALSTDIVTRLREYQNVAQAEMVGDDKKYIGYQPPKTISLKFVPGSLEARTVSEKLTSQGESNFSNLVSRLQQQAASPLKAEVTPQKGLLLQVDLMSLTLSLHERLKALPFVEAVQLNYVMTAF